MFKAAFEGEPIDGQTEVVGSAMKGLKETGDMPAASDKHWTHRLFVENAGLYLPFLGQAKERAEAEASCLADLFSWLGVPEGGSVLDVACGIGRHSVPLALGGYRVAGIDISPLYLRKAKEYAESAGADVRLLCGDARSAESLTAGERPFDAIINMFTSHGYYGRGGDRVLFSGLRRLATPEAALVVLTVNRDWLIRNFKPEGLEKAGPFRVLQQRSFDLETSTIRNSWEFYEGQGQGLKLKLKLDMDHRVYSLHELKEFLENTGWQYLRGLGKQEGDERRLCALTSDSSVMWVVARAGVP